MTRQRLASMPLLVLVTLTLLSASAADAQGLDDFACVTGNRPGATLLVPYFEVDLDDPAGPTTLFSINNADAEPVLAHVVVWSDWALAVLAFDVYLAADDVQTINLRDVLAAGVLPQTGPPPGAPSFPGCTAPLTLPELDADARTRLRARLTGQPDPDNAQCYSRPREPSSRAVGFATIDAVDVCPTDATTPRDPGYFDVDGTGVASNRNVLWGDIFFVDPSQSSAQGIEAVAVVADAERTAIGPTFYGSQHNARLPLASTYRARYLNGDAFAGATELLVWMGGFLVPPEPGSGFTCELAAEVTEDYFLIWRATDEAGPLPEGSEIYDAPAFALRLPVGEPPLEVAAAAGLVELEFFYTDIDSPLLPPAGPVQGWVIPVLRAGDRFSLGLQAVPVDHPLCTITP